MHPGHEDHGHAAVDLHDEGRDEPLGHVQVAGPQALVDPYATLRKREVLHVREPLAPEQLLSHIQRRNADPRAIQPDSGGLGGWLGSAWSGGQAEQPAVPVRVSPAKNCRRLNCLAYWVLMGTSFEILVSATPRTPASGLFFHRANRRST